MPRTDSGPHPASYADAHAHTPASTASAAPATGNGATPAAPTTESNTET
ncbi:hypothetical protein [Streptomyces sp. NPDC006134]